MKVWKVRDVEYSICNIQADVQPYVLIIGKSRWFVYMYADTLIWEKQKGKWRWGSGGKLSETQQQLETGGDDPIRIYPNKWKGKKK